MSADRRLSALARPKSLHGPAPMHELVARPDGAFHLRHPDSGLLSPPNGVYNFVRVQGVTRAQTPLFVSARTGHAALAQGQPVLYAGTMALNHGALAWWSNYSGTYQPSPHFRTQARLPNDKFVPWQELQMGGIGLQRGMLKDTRPTLTPGRAPAKDKPAARPAPPSPPQPKSAAGATTAPTQTVKPTSGSPDKR